MYVYISQNFPFDPHEKSTVSGSPKPCLGEAAPSRACVRSIKVPSFFGKLMSKVKPGFTVIS
jgi:hypothetical protein